MLKLLLAVLLIANLLFFGWSRGWLDDVVGVRARGDREPERFERQLNPDSIVVLGTSGAASAPAPASTSTAPVATVPGAAPATIASAASAGSACLEAGPFDPAQVVAADAALRAALPGTPWTDVRTDRSASWLVYMGPYADRDAMRRKSQEIQRPRLEIEEVSLPSEGEFGLALGRFDDRAAAERALGQLQQRGIRTARVVQAAEPATVHVLRFEPVDAAAAARLRGLRSDALGAGFVPCTGPDTGPR